MEPMSILVPRLWPFLSHTTSSVRKSTLQTLKTLTQCNPIASVEPGVAAATAAEPSNGNDTNQTTEATTTSANINDLGGVINVNATKLSLNFGVKEWPANLLQDALRHIYQRVLVEHLPDIQNLAEEVWVNLVTNADLSALLHAACPYVAAWMCLAMQPARLAFDTSMIIYAKPNTTNPSSSRVSFIYIVAHLLRFLQPSFYL